MSSSRKIARDEVSSAEHVSSSEALAILDVKPQTLYSYVSRGLVRRISSNGRSSLYNRADIQRLKARSKARSGHSAAAESALHWGAPVLLTSITEITPQGPRYRQHLALDLARAHCPFEAVAEYLWSGIEPSGVVAWPDDNSITPITTHLAEVVALYPDMHIRQLLMEVILLLSLASGTDRENPEQGFSIARARALIQAICGSFGFLGPSKSHIRPSPGESIAGVFARAFGIGAGERQLRALNAVFVLLADHEFTPGTFAARIAASAGVDLHSCIGAALQVHFGAALGLRCDRVERALRSPGPVEGPAVLDPRRGLDSLQVGFSHPLYANGDPRAKEILQLALGLDEHAAAARAMLNRLQKIDNHGGNVSLDAALVVFCRALGIRKPVASGLLALSRAAGWIAHVAEQQRQDFMIRPRGKFTGEIETADISPRNQRPAFLWPPGPGLYSPAAKSPLPSRRQLAKQRALVDTVDLVQQRQERW
jgi:citrate synthase